MIESVLVDIVTNLKYKRGWKFELKDGGGMTPGASALYVHITSEDTTPDPWMDEAGLPRVPQYNLHPFDIPEFDWPRGEEWWTNWVLDRIGNVEWHEIYEWFEVHGWKPFFPSHVEVEDLYVRKYQPKPKE